MKLPIAIDFENRFYLFNLPDSAAQSATLFTGSSHYSERLFDDTDVCTWKHFCSFTYLKSSKASYVLGIAIFAYLCFLWSSSIVVLNGVVAAAAVFVVFIGKYYIEMLMSETFVFFHRFVSINLARYLITHIFSIDCELIALCLACISGLLFVDVCYCYVVQFFVLFIIISFHFILLLFFNRFYLSITWFVRSFFITRKFCCLCFCSRIPQYLLSIAFLLIHFHCVLFIYHIFL